MKHTRKKSNGRKKHMLLLPIFLVAVVALIMGATAPQVWADDPVCWFNIEFNASDLDVGVRGFFDYEPWKELEIENPRGREITEVEAKSKMRYQGFAEWFFESGEPTLFEVPFWKFLRRFKPGLYEFEAEPIGGGEVECEELLTHVIPCAPEINVEHNGNIIITWEPVTQVVDTGETDANVALADPEDFDAEDILECEGNFLDLIVGYEVIVEEVDSEKIYKVDLPAGTTSVTVPPEFIDLGDEFQYEVLAIEESGNQTITEDEFCLEDGNLLPECPDDEE